MISQGQYRTMNNGRRCPVCSIKTYTSGRTSTKSLQTDASSKIENLLRNSKPISTFRFLDLSAELRIKIYELCIFSACICPPTDATSLVPARIPYAHTNPFTRKISAAVAGHNISIDGIGALPLLFTNKQIHNEMIPLVYQRFDFVEIVPVIARQIHRANLQIYSQASFPFRWPELQSVSTLKIKLLNEIVRTPGVNWREVYFGETRNSIWPNIPSMIQCIKTMPSLKRLEITDQILGDPALTSSSPQLYDDACWAWLMSLYELKNEELEVVVGFGNSGRCSKIYQNRWAAILAERTTKTAIDLTALDTELGHIAT
ncbi:hypothetical protein B0O99DRAFT_125351 [Bisporella sp. PMI_857]|nr:hypothetical protein B0O99DRAFT_125351 [Bisporella sp. PMI_857]